MVDLRQDETELCYSQCSWVVWVPYILPCLFLDALLVSFLLNGNFVSAVLVFFIGLGVIWGPLTAWTVNELVLTDQRVYGRLFIIKKQILDIPLDKINAVDTRTTLFGRVLHYGSIQIFCANDVKAHCFDRISNYEALHAEITEAIRQHSEFQAAQQADKIAAAFQSSTKKSSSD